MLKLISLSSKSSLSWLSMSSCSPPCMSKLSFRRIWASNSAGIRVNWDDPNAQFCGSGVWILMYSWNRGYHWPFFLSLGLLAKHTNRSTWSSPGATRFIWYPSIPHSSPTNPTKSQKSQPYWISTHIWYWMNENQAPLDNFRIVNFFSVSWDIVSSKTWVRSTLLRDYLQKAAYPTQASPDLKGEKYSSIEH